MKGDIMKMLKTLFISILFAALAGCSTDAIKYQYEAKADFTNLKTFDWFTVEQKARFNEQTIENIKDAVNKNLTAKGKMKVSENPDFLIALKVQRQLKEEEWSITDARYGSYRRRMLPNIYEEGTMILDFVDPETKELLWRGSASATIKPELTNEEQRRRINGAVTKLLDKFPPN
jgi:hypothetical protein